MDPNATLERIEDGIAMSDYGMADEACDDLRDWLDKGGFAPNWQAHFVAMAYYLNH